MKKIREDAIDKLAKEILDLLEAEYLPPYGRPEQKAVAQLIFEHEQGLNDRKKK